MLARELFLKGFGFIIFALLNVRSCFSILAECLFWLNKDSKCESNSLLLYENQKPFCNDNY